MEWPRSMQPRVLGLVRDRAMIHQRRLAALGMAAKCDKELDASHQAMMDLAVDAEHIRYAAEDAVELCTSDESWYCGGELLTGGRSP